MAQDRDYAFLPEKNTRPALPEAGTRTSECQSVPVVFVPTKKIR